MQYFQHVTHDVPEIQTELIHSACECSTKPTRHSLMHIIYNFEHLPLR